MVEYSEQGGRLGMSHEELFQKWLVLARDDLKMADFALSQSLWLQCAFHVQQGIEKSLKGVIVRSGLEDPPYTHDLTRLLDIAVTSCQTLEVYRKTFTSITPFYIRARYPSYKESVSAVLNSGVLKSYIKVATEVIACCEKKKA
jgi:HEPN domain-containing protein